MAADHNKHIHMEKPGGVELADFERLIPIMKKTGKVFHTGYMYRYNPYIKKIMQRVKNGELGRINYTDVESYKSVHKLLSTNTDHLIFLSSYRVYADLQHPVTETAPMLLDVTG